MNVLDRVAAISLIVIAIFVVGFSVLYFSGKLKFSQTVYNSTTYVMPTPQASPSASLLVSPSPEKSLLRTAQPAVKSVVTVSPRK
jgi:hypothetical protein